MMKQSLLYSVLFITFFSALMSCTKTNTNASNTGTFIYMKGSVHRTVNNKDTVFYNAWASDLTVAKAFYPGLTVIGSESADSKIGEGKAGQAFSFTIKNYPGFNKDGNGNYNGAGTYIIDGKNVSGYWSSNGNASSPAISGTITITNGNAQSATGTFSMVFADSTSIQGATFGVLW